MILLNVILLLLLNYYIFRQYYFSLNKLNYDKFFKVCERVKYINSTKYYNSKYIYGKDLWNDFITKEKFNICMFLKEMNLFKYNNSYYCHKLYSLNNKSNINVKGRFPDKSYYRLVPKNKYNYNNVITHTYEVQNYIYNHQHPLNCNNKKYLIIGGYKSGHGSEIHVLTSYLALFL